MSSRHNEASEAEKKAGDASRSSVTASDDHSSEDIAPIEEEQPVQANAAEEPPNGGYGWVCVICVFLINAHTWGLNSSYGVFLAHYLDTDAYPGATRLDFAFVGGLSISMAMAIAPVATLTTRKFGTRVTLFLGIFFETFALIGASFASQIWQLFLSQGVCFGWGMGFMFVGSVGIVPQWFTTKRSFANAIGAAGSGTGGLIYSLSANAIIQRISVGWAFRILGIIAFAVNTTCSLLIKDRNKQVGASQRMFDHTLLKRYEFMLLCAFGFFSMLGYVVLIFSLPNYANSIGLGAQKGAVIGAVLNLGQAIGRPPIGYFSDSFGRINMAAVMTFLSGLFILVIWVFANSYGVLIFYALIGGTVAGTYWTVIGPVTTEVVGLRELPSALSIIWLTLVLPDTFTEAIALKIVDSNGGDYLGAQLFAGFMYIAAFLSLFLLRAWKIGDVEKVAALNARSPEKLDVTRVTSREAGAHSRDLKTSPLVKRLLTWAKV